MVNILSVRVLALINILALVQGIVVVAVLLVRENIVGALVLVDMNGVVVLARNLVHQVHRIIVGCMILVMVIVVLMVP